jgi:hypothetical protein
VRSYGGSQRLPSSIRQTNEHGASGRSDRLRAKAGLMIRVIKSKASTDPCQERGGDTVFG